MPRTRRVDCSEPGIARPGDPVEPEPVAERVRRAVLDLIAGDEDAPGVEEHAAA